jgi:spoIIIJ-associated protein
MEWVETTGPTVDQAKDAALDQLGVDEQDAEFEVLEQPRTGLFGRLRTEARVRARVRPATPRPKEDRRERRGRRSDGARGGRSSGGRGPGGSGSGSPGRRSDQDRPARVTASVDSDEGPRQPGERSERPAGSGRNRRRGGRGAGPGGRTAALGDDELATNDGGSAMDVPIEQQGEVAEEFLAGLLEAFEVDADIAVTKIDDETLELAVSGGDLGLLIGAKGATLQAIQDLTRTVVQRRTGASHGRLMVDISSYRQKRRVALERFATQLAEEVRSSGERKVLEPMSAADRKVVHDTVNALEGVTTTSEGEEPRRRVVILPGESEA